MAKQHEIIKIFCSKLPYVLSNQLFNEYENRLKEIKYNLENRPLYASLKQDIEVIKILLAFTIFHKRVISNFDAATKFANTVSGYSLPQDLSYTPGELLKNTSPNKGGTIIKIGDYELNGEELNRIDRIIYSFRVIRNRYSIPDEMMEYEETVDLLRHIKKYKLTWIEIDKNKKTNGGKKNTEE